MHGWVSATPFIHELQKAYPANLMPGMQTSSHSVYHCFCVSYVSFMSVSVIIHVSRRTDGSAHLTSRTPFALKP